MRGVYSFLKIILRHNGFGKIVLSPDTESVDQGLIHLVRECS